MKRALSYIAVALVVFAVGVLAAIRPSIATAHEGGASISCSSVGFSYTDFANATNVVSEVVTIDGATVHSGTFTFTGSSGSHSVSISVPADGSEHYVVASASWDTNGHQGSFREMAKLKCGESPPTTETTPPSPWLCPDGKPPEENPVDPNDNCKRPEPVVPPVVTTPPATTTTTTSTTTETTAPTPAPPVVKPVKPPVGSQPTPDPAPDATPRPRKPRGVPPSAPPPCRPGMVETKRCGVQGSG